ncbi:hypothetical protein L486_02181 [Kwoniella mangroviensis CBS 10435]|uniref:BTB domain-containing protein n=1 Tax=Kwoniella mangroviensis CBS 10435 TaxID=1331196 RepID=A0A1B9IVS3_9TREE|nr:hypothetical protein L486_02181 [Kwoniella mangroviensis CBS 10435]
MSIKSQTRPSKRKTDQSTDNTSVKKLKHHPFHHGPEHSITIISDDNIGFKASRSRLVQTCQFFKDLLDIPAPEHENQEPNVRQTIPLDFRSSIISTFLDLISVSQKYPPQLDFVDAEAFLNFVEYTMSDDLIPFARTALKEVGAKKPLELLVIASNKNDIDLARFALGKITPEQIHNLYGKKSSVQLLKPASVDKLQEYLKRLRTSFHLEILSRMMLPGEVRGARQDSLRPGLYLADDWTSIAESFDPTRFEESLSEDSTLDDSDHLHLNTDEDEDDGSLNARSLG